LNSKAFALRAEVIDSNTKVRNVISACFEGPSVLSGVQKIVFVGAFDAVLVQGFVAVSRAVLSA